MKLLRLPLKKIILFEVNKCLSEIYSEGVFQCFEVVIFVKILVEYIKLYTSKYKYINIFRFETKFLNQF